MRLVQLCSTMRLALWLIVVLGLCEAQEWWRTATFYQIYPRSFMDSNGDGIGDLNGITSKLDYLKDIGVTAVWLSPIYKSPMADFGYDISDFRDVDPLFGSLSDLDVLITEVKKRGMYIILDFVPNHSSNLHPWFNSSVYKEGNYADYYVWKNSLGTAADGSPIVPNNWQNAFSSGTVWEWNDVRQQFYLHHFVIGQPDLNYRNPLVVQEMKDVVQFWLDKGIDGFRGDAVNRLVEDVNFLDEPLINPSQPLSFNNLNHTYTTNMPETLEVIAGWSEIIRQQNVNDGRARVLFLEVYDTTDITMTYFGSSSAVFQMPFNFVVLGLMKKGMTATDLVANFNEWMSKMKAGYTANWVIGNHDNRRVASRAGREIVDTLNMMLAMLPGIMITYNGDELGMYDTFVTYEETVDPSGCLLGPSGFESGTRDPVRTPLQWDNTTNAGFSSAKPWLPVNPNYWQLNAAAQTAATKSHMKVYRALNEMRKDVTFSSNTSAYEFSAPDQFTLIIKRSSNEGDTYVLIANLGSSLVTKRYQLTNVVQMTVRVASINSGYNTGDVITLSSGVTLRPKAAVVLQSPPA